MGRIMWRLGILGALCWIFLVTMHVSVMRDEALSMDAYLTTLMPAIVPLAIGWIFHILLTRD